MAMVFVFEVGVIPRNCGVQIEDWNYRSFGLKNSKTVSMGAGGSVRSRSRMTTCTPVVAVKVTKKTGNEGSKGRRVQKMVNKIQDRIAERKGSVVVGGHLNSVMEETEDAKDDDETEQQHQLNHPSYVSRTL